jgi:drug/metabolite transporter (DMT)-like permease
MSFIPSVSLVTGEGLMSLYPVLVKNTNLDLMSQTWIRLITATIVCYPFISNTIGHVVNHVSFHIVSVLYLIHIWASYVGFLNLEVCAAITLFYTYPIINVVLNNLLTYHLDKMVFFYFFVSFVGVLFITRIDSRTSSANHFNVPLGLGAMSLSVLTESLIYLFYKTSSETNPFNMLFNMSLGGSILLSIIYWYRRTPHGINNQAMIKVGIANLFLGVIGYLLRFYSLPQLTTEWFSILSFSGIIFGYLYGWWFYHETINLSKIIGTLLIIFSVYQVKSLGY